MTSKDLMPSEEDKSNSASYEMFLSFRGSDTRYGFTDHLYTAFINVGVRVYRDDEELRFGEEIGPGLLEGIKESKIAIPIFSKDYASSKWCLKELAEIMKWKQSTGMKVMPIFYYVEPSEVRSQTGDYGKAFESHEKYYDEKTIREWREALRQVGQLKGWEIQKDKNRQEGKLVDEVINVVLRELKKAYTIVTDYLIGVEHHVEAILNMIANEANDARIVGIYGMGGIGKTTLAKVIYNHLLSHYESYSFLADVRETSLSKGIEFLQKKMISDLLRREWTNITNTDEGILIISERFVNKKVLILLDDVDQRSQLKGLVGKRKWFGPGSRIIVTTRNKTILDSIEVDWPYELSCMDSQHALQLFSKHAFRSDRPLEEFAILSQKAVEIAKGLPLALELFGSLLCGKDKTEWDFTLRKLEKVPEVEVGRKLKISFDVLDDRQKQIFLDIACFFVGANARIAIHFWNGDELFPEEAIEVLQQMSLIKIQEDNSIWMHDQLRDMGRDIVRKEHIEPEKRSRLWSQEDATDFFTKKMGHENVRGICLNFGQRKQYHFPSEELALLPNLRFLRVRGDRYITSKRRYFFKNWFPWNNSSFSPYKSSPIFSKLRWLSWEGFPPTNRTIIFSLENLVFLDLSRSRIQTGWRGWRYVKMAKKLRVLNLTGCRRLIKTPDLSSHPLLEQLILRECYNLVEIDESISMLKNLVIIDLKFCRRLRKLPKELSCTESLEELTIHHSSILEIPDWPGMKRLTVLNFTKCYSLKNVSSLNFATSLWKLSLAYCCEVQTLPQSIGNLVSLKELDLSHSGIVELPQSIGNLVSLEELDLSYSKIVELPQSIGNLLSLEELDLSHSRIDELAGMICNLKNLIKLSVGWTPIRELPATISMMENLLRLDASGCFDLVNLPKFPQSLISLKASNIKLERIPDLSNLIHLRNLELLSAEGPFDPSEAGSPTLWWIGRLTSLETLKLGFSQVITLNADLVVLSQLKELKIFCCHNLQIIPKLPSSLTSLSIRDCRSLETLLNLPPSLKELEIKNCGSLRTLLDLPSGLTYLSIKECWSLGASMDLSHMRQLDFLLLYFTSLSKLEGLSGCKSLRELVIKNCGFFEIEGLETLESLTRLSIFGCEQLRMLPDLSNLNKLEKFVVRHCPSLVEIFGRLQSLDVCSIYGCKSLVRIPDIPNFRNMGVSCILDKRARKLLHELHERHN